MIFGIFHAKSHYGNGHFDENSESHIKDEFVKIRDQVIFFIRFSFKNDNFGLRLKILNFSEVSLLKMSQALEVVRDKRATSMLVTDVGDKMCWWQF